MLVIADTSPLNYLILIDAVRLLPRLYQRVVLPHAAWDELKHPGAPAAVSRWASSLPPWVEVQRARIPLSRTQLWPRLEAENAKQLPWLSCTVTRQKFSCCWTKMLPANRPLPAVSRLLERSVF